jgi:hypothetical protein
MRRLCQVVVLLAAAFGSAGSVSAFSDYELFALPPLEGGGGGGRYFTASPVDGYGCGVCHLGGVEPFVTVHGLPEHEYVPGTTYNVEVAWLYPQFPHALNLELVNPLGQAAGLLALPDASALEPADRCDPSLGAAPAAHLIAEGARQILSMDDCGSTRLRFLFTAPAEPELTFAASIVRTDKSEKPEGDGVLEIRRVLHPQGYQPDAVVGGNKCSVAAVVGNPPPGVRSVSFVTLCLGLALCVRRRRAQALRPSDRAPLSESRD